MVHILTRVLSIDLETYSESDIGDCGVHKYCEDPAFEVMLFAYSEDYGPVQVVDLMSGEFIPRRITDMIFDPNVLKTAYNAPFERTALATHFGMECPAEQWECTMVLGAVSGYPLGLDKLSKALGLAEDKAKMSEGKRLVKYFCSPCKPTKNNGMRTRNMPWDDPEKWQKFIEYNRQDVVAENEIRKQLIRNRPDETEHKFWVLDQYINDTGIRIDMQLARNASAIGKEIKDGLIAQARRLTGLENPASNAQLKVWLEDVEGKEFPSLSKDAMPDVWAQLETEEAREVLRMREQWSLSSLAKYEAMLVGTCEDDHARGLFQFYGAARTGRFSGRRIQLQNLKRNNIKDLALARQVVRDGDRELMELLFDGADTLSELVRTALIAEEGSRFIVADFSAIEARVIAWFAGEEWVLDEFRGEGKIYEATASNMFHVPKELIVKGNPEYELRQKGKTAVLGLGYNGGPQALIKMGALKQGLSEEELPGLVDLWRKANPNIVKWWKSVEQAAMKAVKEKGRRIDAQGGVAFSFEEGNLYATLPSGRRLCYPKVHITTNRFGNESIGYWGQNQTTGQWCRLETYGGKLVENIVQGTARDCLRDSMLRLADAGYDIRAHVHDEVIINEPYWSGRTQEDVCAIMGQPVDWAPGLPLSAASYETFFYLKD